MERSLVCLEYTVHETKMKKNIGPHFKGYNAVYNELF